MGPADFPFHSEWQTVCLFFFSFLTPFLLYDTRLIDTCMNLVSFHKSTLGTNLPRKWYLQDFSFRFKLTPPRASDFHSPALPRLPPVATVSFSFCADTDSVTPRRTHNRDPDC